MAARVLSQTGKVAGAVGWGYAGTLGLALVYLGEHYVTDLLAGAALAEGVRVATGPLDPVGKGIASALSGLQRKAAGQ
jgi:membrane-associated phospholipid phosphatase